MINRFVLRNWGPYVHNSHNCLVPLPPTAYYYRAVLLTTVKYTGLGVASVVLSTIVQYPKIYKAIKDIQAIADINT